MNSFILMAEILSEPELRRTPDNQSSIASFLVRFPDQRDEAANNTLKVSGWNTLAEQIMEQHHKGDQVLLEGRLQINKIDRNGYKENRAEMTVQRIHPLGNLPLSNLPTPAATGNTTGTATKSSQAAVPKAVTESAPDYDNIPF
jgi:single-strand DNA-binding protein